MSSPELVARYLRERARPRLFVPLAVCIALVGAFITPSSDVSVSALVLTALEAFLLVMAFRVWDDLEDRDRDRVLHPGRTMPSDRRTVPFVALSLAFTVAALIPITGGANVRARLVSLCAAAALLMIWYRLRPTSGGGSYVVLLKYPLIAYATAPGLMPSPGSLGPRGFSALAALYVAIGVYDAVDDRSLHHSSTTPGLP